MRAMISSALIFSLFFSPLLSYGATLPARGAELRSRKLLEIAVWALNIYPTAGDVVKVLKRAEDRDFVLAKLGARSSLPLHAQFIERNTVVIRIGQEQVSFAVKDIHAAKFSVFKHEYSFDPNESAEKAIERLSRLVARVDRFQLLEPEAKAILPAVAVLIYLSIAGTVGVSCAQNNVNSVGFCTGVGLGWPVIAVVAWYGALAVTGERLGWASGLIKTRLDLRELNCAEGDKPLVATVMDANGSPLKIELRYKKNGRPESVTYINATGGEKRMVLDDPIRARDVLDLWEIGMALESAKAISESCKNRDSRSAMEKYLKDRQGATILVPKVDGNGITTKKIE